MFSNDVKPITLKYFNGTRLTKMHSANIMAPYFLLFFSLKELGVAIIKEVFYSFWEDKNLYYLLMLIDWYFIFFILIF